MKSIVVLLIISLLSGCSILGTYIDPQHPAPEYHLNGQAIRVNFVQLNPTWISQHDIAPRYRVGPFDILNIIVWDHPELTTITTQLSTPQQSGFLVSPGGNIAFPYAGTVKVAGLTLPEIEKKIEQKISKYVRNPQVTVLVVSFRSQEVETMGEIGVNIIPLTDKPTSLLEALNKGGGTNVMDSDTARIFVIRANNVSHVTVYALNAKSPEMMIASEHFYLQNNDIVYVPALAIVDWDRLITQVLAFGSGARAAHDFVHVKWNGNQ